MATERRAFAATAPNDLSSLDWPSLEKIAAVRFTDPHRQMLLNALSTLVYGLAIEQQYPRIKALRAHLNKITSHARTLRSLLADASPTGQSALFWVLPPEVAEPAALLRLLDELAFNAAAAEKRLSGEPGQPKEVHRDRWIRAWFTVYLEAGGMRKGCCYWDRYKRRYMGRFLDLLQVALQQANAQVCNSSVKQPAMINYSRDALAKAILAIIPSSRQQSR
jgi:hypothetical protein